MIRANFGKIGVIIQDQLWECPNDQMNAALRNSHGVVMLLPLLEL